MQQNKLTEKTATMNLEQARHNMVEQQIRPWQVLDNQVLDLIASLPRELFVTEDYQDFAYIDSQIPLEHGQCMMSPKEEARMLQALRIQKSDVILEIGTGSGYCSALLASLGHKVYSVDIIEDFIKQAEQKTEKLGLTNIIFEEGDAANGWPHYKPYDVIAITGGFYQLPESYKRSLRIGGRLFCIEGEKPAMTAKLITRLADDEWHEQPLFETEIPLLINIKQAEKFIF